jgi:hypothetical protein
MINKITRNNLQKFNLFMGLMHFVQGVLILVLSKEFFLPISGSYLEFNRMTEGLEPVTKVLFDVSLPMLIAAFFFLSAVFHVAAATIFNKEYNEDISVGLNRFRWIEYSVSASIMMVAIALLVGVYDIMSLTMIFGLTAVMNMMGLVMEVHNQTTKRTNWLSYIIGCFAGALPWVVVVFSFWLTADNGGETPTFVYWIFVSIFLFFNAFALNMFLQYKKIGKWKNYIYGERAYIILSLVAKTLLAWQVFAGTLRP